MVEGETGLLHGISDGHSLEVSTVVDSSSLSIDQRVVCGWWRQSTTDPSDGRQSELTRVAFESDGVKCR